MGAKLASVANSEHGTMLFHCPACECDHGFNTAPGGWKWDGNLESPSVSPSLRVMGGWGKRQDETVCHLFVRNGQIEYCSDSPHALAGKTVPMVDYDSEEW